MKVILDDVTLSFQWLRDGTELGISDRGLAPLPVARFAVAVLVDPALDACSTSRRSRRWSRLRAANPTALDTVLAGCC